MNEVRCAFVVLTAMPPTKGHLNLIRFATQIGDDTEIVLFTQPHEPFVAERAQALRYEFPDHNLLHIDRTLPQDPETPGFWDLWTKIMVDEVGVRPCDFIVSSEPYGQRLADITGAKFMPYDPYREITPCKATDVRVNPTSNFDLIAPMFQHNLRRNITIFGAESTGKTTLAKDLAERLNGHYFMEWARPYLETCSNEITVDTMTDIWKGQAALEAHSHDFFDKPYAFYDTDLYSTIGYWRFPHWHDIIGDPPQGLIDEAGPSDLYIICPANIPFEEDPLRYGGDKREATDEYWIQVAKDFGLTYVVLQEYDRAKRVEEASAHIARLAEDVRTSIYYDRGGF